jgi:hypothetical protein
VLAEVDARTLKPITPARVSLGSFGLWSLSPEENELAVSTGFTPRGGTPTAVGLRFVDLVSMRLTGSVRLGPDPGLTTGYVDPLALVSWIAADTVVVIRLRANRSLELVGVDAARRSVRWRKPFTGSVLASVPAGGELVLLVGEENRIVSPRLVAVGADGRVRSARLGRLRAGWSWDRKVNPPIAETKRPGLAVDETTRTAYVAAPSGLVAEIALDGLHVRYHSLRGTFAKYQSGAVRQAVSLGRGVLAVSGSNSTVEKSDGKLYQVVRASGLELVDTHSGMTRLIDATATSVALWRGGLVSAGRTWDSRVSSQPGGGLTIFDREGAPNARLFAGSAVSLVGVHGDLAYAYVGDDRVTVDLAAGLVVDRGARAFPLLR